MKELIRDLVPWPQVSAAPVACPVVGLSQTETGPAVFPTAAHVAAHNPEETIF